jgi:type I restriction enzyme S subunit
LEVDILNIPKLRFKEFTDEWQRNSLNKLTTYVDYRGKTPQKTDNGIFLVTAKNIKMGYIDYEISKEYISENDFNDVMKRGFVQKGDVLFTTEAPMGNVAQIYNEHIALAQRVIKFRGIPLKLKNTFLKYNLMSFRFQKLLKEKAIGTTVLGIQGKVLHKLPIIYPQLKEQEKIADFLSTVDKKVENLENTITSLENQKKGLLQQIFSQKLRFKDKNGNNYPNWEKKKLGDIATLKNGISKSNEAFGHGKKFINLQDIFNKSYIFNDNYSLVDVTEKELSENNLLKGDVLFVRSSVKREGVGLPCVIMENLIDTVYSGFIIRCRFNINENIYLHYKKYCFLEFSFRKALLKKSSSSANTNINQDNLSKLYVKLPCLEEQTKIADFLSAFDRKLENKKAQLKHWQQIKKGLLQQMFV